VTLITLANWIRVFDLGIGGGMRLKLSEAIALNQYTKGRIFISTTYGIIGGLFILILVLFYMINPKLNWQGILNTSIVTQYELIKITTVSITFIVIGFILQTVSLIYLADGNSAAGAIIQLIISSIILVLVWFVSRWAEQGNLLLLAWIATGTPVLVYAVFSAYTFIVKYPHFRPSIKLIKIKETGNLLSLSLQVLVSSVTYMILYGSIPIIIAHLFSPNEVTIFNIAYSIYNVPIVIIGLVTAPILPLVTLAYTKQDYMWIREMLKKMNLISLIISGGTIIMIIISPWIFHIWIGDKVEIPFMLSVSIGIYAIITTIQTPFSTFTNGTGRIKILTIFSPITIVLFIAISLLLSRLLNNVIGVSIALSFIAMVMLIVLPLWLKKHLHV
jgi:O-antigen/teichoic acid export membrane protein